MTVLAAGQQCVLQVFTFSIFQFVKVAKTASLVAGKYNVYIIGVGGIELGRSLVRHMHSYNSGKT